MCAIGNIWVGSIIRRVDTYGNETAFLFNSLAQVGGDLDEL